MIKAVLNGDALYCLPTYNLVLNLAQSRLWKTTWSQQTQSFQGLREDF